MKRKSCLIGMMIVLAAIFCLIEVNTVISQTSQTFHQIPLSYNISLQNCWLRSNDYMAIQGDIDLGGIPFSIPSYPELNAWTSYPPWNPDPFPITLDIPVSLTGVNRVYTLINTIGGEEGGPYEWIEFWC